MNLPPVLWLIGVFALLYVIFAGLSAETGYYCKPIFWTIMPLWPLLYFLSHLSHVATYIRIRKNYSRIALVVVPLVAAALVMVVFIYSFFWWTTFMPSHYPLVYVAGNILLICALALPLLNMMYTFLTFLRDELRWRVWARNHRSPINIQELCEALEGYYTPHMFCNRILRHVREQHLQDETQETSDFLRKIALEIELDKQSNYEQRRKLRLAKKKGGIVANLLWKSKNLKAHNVFILYADFQTLDEINMLLEDTDAANKRRQYS